MKNKKSDSPSNQQNGVRSQGKTTSPTNKQNTSQSTERSNSVSNLQNINHSGKSNSSTATLNGKPSNGKTNSATASQNGMESNGKSNSSSNTRNGKQTNVKSTNGSIKSSQLMKLFEDELKDIYWAEKALTKAIPKMIKKATSQDLIEALTSHLSETHKHVTRIEQVFESLDKKAVAKKCDAMEGLIKEAEGIMEDCEQGAMCDAGIISAGQKVEHYEIASYGTLRQFAEILGIKNAETLLGATLSEEKTADLKLSKIAQSINIEASQENTDK